MTRAALVTGGSSGIGFAIAAMLAGEGHVVTICGRDEAKARQAAARLPGDAHGVRADVGAEADVRALVRAHVDAFGRLDVLVNSAGISQAGAAGDTSAIDREIAVNLRGPLLVMRETMPLLLSAGSEHGKALIVNVASVAGKLGQPSGPVYSATKAGLISLTESTQRAHAGAGVQATALCPGLVATPMTAGSSVPAEEMVAPDDIAEAVRFLLRASPWCLVPEIVLNRRGALG